MLKQNRYSAIRGEPAHKPADGLNLNAFYDGLTRPVTILGVFLYAFTLLKDDLPVRLGHALGGNGTAFLYLVVVLLTLVAMARVFQSLLLAKRDYPHLDSRFRDIFLFLLVAVLFQQTLIWLNTIGPFGGLLVLFLLASVGFVHFYDLLRRRIPKGSEQYDYPIEWRIQLVNTLVFAYLVPALGVAAYLTRGDAAGEMPMAQATMPAIVIVSACLALTFNMVHSQQLTLMPKLLLKNDPDSPEALTNLFRTLFWRSANGLDDAEVQGRIAKDIGPFRALRTVRAGWSDVEKIAEALVGDFRHVFGYLFDTADTAKLRCALMGLLRAGGGLGELGYMNFYVLMHRPGPGEDRVPVGFIRVDTAHGCGIYRMAAGLSSFVTVVRLFGLRKLPPIYRRRKELLAMQPGPAHKEIRLTYIVIFPEHRGLGYGSSAVRLLVNALLWETTNEIVTDRITLFVRKANRAALLFRRAGFVPAPVPAGSGDDPLAADPAAGPCEFLEFARDRIAATDTVGGRR